MLLLFLSWFLTCNGTKWPKLCLCAVKKLLTHSLTHLSLNAHSTECLLWHSPCRDRQFTDLLAEVASSQFRTQCQLSCVWSGYKWAGVAAAVTSRAPGRQRCIEPRRAEWPAGEQCRLGPVCCCLLTVTGDSRHECRRRPSRRFDRPAPGD